MTIEAPIARRERSTLSGAPIGVTPVAATTGRWTRTVEHLADRKWALATIVVYFAVSLAYCFLWGPIVRHQAIWVVPGDIWSTYRDAHLVGWGNIGGIYNPDYGLLTFPGIVVLLAPVAMITGHFGLTESFGCFTVSHPSAWLWLGPVTLLLGGWCLMAFDAMAEALGVGRGKRVLMLVAEAAVVFQVVTFWGHPEDMMAIGLATYALLMGSRGRWTSAGWLWGAAIAFQPLALVLLPLALATAPRGSRLRLCFCSALPSAVLLAAPLTTQWHMTIGSMLHQSNRTDFNHPTPWIVFSSHLPAPHMVTAGPGRMIALLAAVVIGGVAWRLRPSLAALVWMGALALCLRCFFESVMDTFYLGPPFALILLASAVRPGRVRLVAASVTVVVAFVYSFHHLGEWAYWLPLMALLAFGLACGWPGRDAFRPAKVPDIMAVEALDQPDPVPV